MTILIASFVVFMALSAAPGDPVSQLLGGHPSPEVIAATRHKLGLDQPLLVQYWHWLTGVVHGDLGLSIVYRTDVSTVLSGRISVTISLVAYSAVLVLVCGVGLGVLGGSVRRLGPWVAAITALGVATPAFVAAIILVAVFALRLGWFPALGTGEGFFDSLWHLTLPAIALTLGGAAYIAQVTRAAIFDEAAREHVTAARGRGLGSRDVFLRHQFRNALVPILTVSALTVAGLVAGTVVVEYAFAINGLGSLLVSSVIARDKAVVEAIMLILLVVFTVTLALIDVVQVALDPRARTRRLGP